MPTDHELFQEYLDKNQFYHFEGERGVRRLEQIAKDIGGYGDIREFLADNPAACEACIEFFREFIPRVPEWREALVEIMKEGDEQS